MATHDYIISNASGAAVRADLNNALAAIATNNSSATEPTTTYAYQWWADTGSSPTVMKLRNAANSGWITLFQLDGEWTVVPFENGTAAAPSIYFKDSGTDTGIYSPGTDQVGISAGGTSRFEVSTSATTSTLPVVHPLGAVGTPSITFTGDLNTGIWSPAADTVAVSTNGTRAITIDSSQRLGIGTASPGYPLTVVGASALSDWVYIGSASGARGISSDSTARSLLFAIDSSEKARIDTSGRLLVGTSSSSANASIVCQGTSASSIGAAQFWLQRGQAASGIAAGDTLGRINFADNAGNLFAWIDGQTDAAAGTNDYPSRLVFATCADSASSPTERCRITSTGHLLIGTTTTGLENSRSFSFVTTGAGEATFNHSTANGTGDNWCVFGYNGNKIGSITQNGTTGTTYSTTSDYRLKENVEPVVDSITRLQQLKPSRFNFIAEPDRTVDGFIAHEVQAVVPEAITGTKDEIDEDGNPVYQGIDQSKLVPLLTAALQEAVAKIESLEARLTAAGI